jgi:hypothetical protein
MSNVNLTNISANTADMRTALEAAYTFTEEHFKVLPKESRETLFAIIHNLSNPSVGIPLSKNQIKILEKNIQDIKDPKKFLEMKGKRDPATIAKKIEKIFKNQFHSRVSSSKLNKAMNQLGENYKKNTFMAEHHFTVKHSVDFEENVKNLWESVNAGKLPSVAKGACESRIFPPKTCL